MSREYYDPWAKVGGAAQNAFIKYAGSRPSQADVEKEAANAAKLNAEAGILQDRRNASNNLADLIGGIYQNVEAPRQDPSFVGAMPPTAPSPEVVNQNYNKALPELFSNAMRYGAEDPGDLGKIFAAFAGNLGATPDQLTNAQMGAGVDFANTEEGFYANPDNSGYTLSPGAIRLNNQNQQVAQAPFKKGGGMQFRMNPDGTVEFSEDGGIDSNLGKPVINDLQQKDTDFMLFDSMSNKYLESIKSNPISVGTRGNLLRAVDGVSGQVESFFPNSEASKLLDSVDGKLRTQGIIAGEQPNQDIYAASSLGNLMPFAVGAIVGQSGKDLSDGDRALLAKTLGSADDWTAQPDKIEARVRAFQSLVSDLRQKYQGKLRGDSSSNLLNNIYPNEVSQDNSFTKQNGYDVVNESPIAQGFGNVVNSPASQELTPAERAEYEQLMREGF